MKRKRERPPVRRNKMDKFVVGVLLGMVGGALITANNYKMRTLVKKGQEEVTAKFNELMDEKIEMITKAKENIEEKVEEKIDETFDGDNKKKSSK